MGIRQGGSPGEQPGAVGSPRRDSPRGDSRRGDTAQGEPNPRRIQDLIGGFSRPEGVQSGGDKRLRFKTKHSLFLQLPLKVMFSFLPRPRYGLKPSL